MSVIRKINGIEYRIDYDRHTEKYIVKENGVILCKFDRYTQAVRYLDAYLKVMR